jgi:hypothetical protein
MSPNRRRLAAAAAALSMASVAVPASGASAATPPPVPSAPPMALTFVPPRVGSISVTLGRTVIDGQVMAPGLHVVKPEVTISPSDWAAALNPSSGSGSDKPATGGDGPDHESRGHADSSH